MYFSGQPDPVKDFKIKRNEQKLNEPYNRTTLLTWALPCRQNGLIDQFRIEFSNLGTRESFHRFVDVTDQKEDYDFSTEDLIPDSSYNITISAQSGEVQGKLIFQHYECEAGCKDLMFFV